MDELGCEAWMSELRCALNSNLEGGKRLEGEAGITRKVIVSMRS